ncbi:putative sterigmatocystin biosynthesis peroxidase [Escovopsis weberi]|uniref:Putative sterigmatocystin biosynthesis peroxidase n=1 Tax=Escovopsis weberi TaxID=150374 RepID=A0A0M8N696_ESCWE|nr:putative sterigmatocystin biosynthesis peroxidase [Escovopsis weberi]
MLNTLANHGYLPHDGKNISVEEFGDAVAALNIHPDLGLVPAAFFANATKKARFDLLDLNTPGIEQHLASLTRLDWDHAHAHPEPDSRRIDDLLLDSRTDSLTIESLAISRLRLEDASIPRELSPVEKSVAVTEAALLMAIMMDGTVPAATARTRPNLYSAPKQPVRIFLNDERFPVEHGWAPPERLLRPADIKPISDYIADSMRRHRRDWFDH